jgi:glycerophosphoryl diester phosphodiesterase
LTGPIRYPFLDHDGPLAFAHRGGAGDCPENTMPAFEAAVALGYRYLETDVHVTLDGVVVAFHDSSLDRVTDRVGLIRELPYREVAEARVGGLEPIPLLEDLLGTWPEVRLNIDCKHDSAVDALVEVLQRTGATARVCLAAFSDRRLGRLRSRLGPTVATGLGPKGIARLRAASIGLPAGQLVGACAQVPPSRGPLRIVDERFVTAAHRLGLQVHVWTIDEASEMESLLDLGVDGIMTDRPATLKEVLVRRGEWAPS